ncbi:hypothetical protein [Polyangium sorediatum]|uniref:Uncharacterized protein n=1 Tax=Polyangium sorediatum TaxID=889274 RepID=A0ABT6NL35_9BACT|nr:hypothetical protein [Polyangium sorediatum]MDI1428957.1 hypothetical protein [Polyangium sorediatum]
MIAAGRDACVRAEPFEAVELSVGALFGGDDDDAVEGFPGER